MIGRFIFLCDSDHFDVACDAGKYLLENPDQKQGWVTQTDGEGGSVVKMFAKRLKKSIRIQQVLP